jgi:hypothetical protein
LLQRAWAARRADSLRCSLVIFLARALPPIRANSVIVRGFATRETMTQNNHACKYEFG